MAAEAIDRDMIFANFQAASGIDDYEHSISILESNNWNLQSSLNDVFTARENENQHLLQTQHHQQQQNIPYMDLDADHLGISILERDTESLNRSERNLNFHIIWHDRTLHVTVDENETVGALKRRLEMQTCMMQAEINLEGWPLGDASATDYSVLSSLNLPQDIHLVLHSPMKVTVSPAEYVPCNIVDVENDQPGCPRVIDVDLHDSGMSSSFISLNVNHDGRDYKLRYASHKTIKDVKQELFMLTKIPTKQQLWTGWPEGANDQSQLGRLELSQPDYFLLLTSHPVPESSTVVTANNWDSGTAGSPEDTDLEEQVISDDDDIFDTSGAQAKRLTPLLQRDSPDTPDALIQFQHKFEERYGEFHPAFFIGPLKDAIDEAAGESALERRPLLVYLHHDGSIMVNIFCSQILCSDQFVSFVSQNFVIWPWDMTFRSNRQRFVNLLTQHCGNIAAHTITRFRDGEYPLLLIIMKSKSGLEVCSVLQANNSLQELMTALISGYDVFEQTKLVEIQSENERFARESMINEQDAAFQESLAADRAKVEAEKKRMQEEIEKQQQEQLNAQLREAERVSCEEQLPEEPPATSKCITQLVFRFPNGEREGRRFNETDKLKMVFLYVVSKGYTLNEHRVVTNFPRRQLSEENSQQTLKELKLCPQETLFVEER